MDGIRYDLIVKKHNQQTGRQFCCDFGSEMCYFWNFQKGAEQWFFAANDPTDATGCSMGELNTIYIYMYISKDMKDTISRPSWTKILKWWIFFLEWSQRFRLVIWFYYCNRFRQISLGTHVFISVSDTRDVQTKTHQITAKARCHPFVQCLSELCFGAACAHP